MYPPQGTGSVSFSRLAPDGVSTEYVLVIDGKEIVLLTVLPE